MRGKLHAASAYRALARRISQKKARSAGVLSDSEKAEAMSPYCRRQKGVKEPVSAHAERAPCLKTAGEERPQQKRLTRVAAGGGVCLLDAGGVRLFDERARRASHLSLEFAHA